MPKMKTNKSVQKRFHATKGGKGKLMALQVGVRHGRTALRRKTIRSKTKTVELPTGYTKHVKNFLPYGTKS